MAMRERIYKVTDAPMTWTRAIVLGTFLFVLATFTLGQAPSLIIYKFDQYVAEIIEFTTKIPGVNEEGLNAKQVSIVRDIVANAVQNTFLIMFLAGAYFWQKSKQKRTGAKGLTDPVKGYMPGK
jgi:Na+/H+ antiporter NhaC